MMCGIDFENQGFNMELDRMTELGAVIFDPLTMFQLPGVSTLVYAPSYHPQTEEIVEITGITDEMLKEKGVSFERALLMLDEVIGQAGGITHFVAHNAAFDKRVLHAELRRAEAIPQEVREKYLAIPWICTMNDIAHPAKFKSKKLSHLALDYGVTVDPSTLHRSIADVQLMLQMCVEGGIDLMTAANRSAIPDVIVRAVVPSPFGAGNDGGKGKDKAKLCGFGWQRAPGTDGPEIKNAWLKKVKENEIESEKEKLGYEIRIVG